MASLASHRIGPPVATGPADWQAVLADGLRDPIDLCRTLHLDPSLAVAARHAAGDFPLLVPRPLLDRIRRGDPKDPLLVQVLPQPAERAEPVGFSRDPLGEIDATCCPGLLRKYRGRCVIVATRRCAVHCRFCFRRHFPHCDAPMSLSEWGPAFREIAADWSIREVILSGGDPLTLPDEYLAQFASRLAAIPHLGRVRVHTRLPVVIPQRVDDGLLGWLRATRLTTLMVIHVNHPAEIDPSVADALGRLVDAGVPLLSQSVLLRGVNDRAEVLAGLFERLAELRVMPYYLHQLDRIAGAAHFEVPVSHGLELIRQLRAQLPGYAVPRYVREIPGRPSKEVLA